MREIYGDLWELSDEMEADAVCITTNSTITFKGENVMGGGCAKEAKERYPDLPYMYAQALLMNQNGPGNIPVVFSHAWLTKAKSYKKFDLIMFPTKNEVWKDSSLELIEKSAWHLITLQDWNKWKTVLLPRPGCGLGGLDWDEEVKPLMEKCFASCDWLYIVTYES